MTGIFPGGNFLDRTLNGALNGVLSRRSDGRGIATVAICVVWCLCALASVTWTRHGGGVSMIWPANAVMLAAILRIPGFDRRFYPLLLFIMAALVNLEDHRPWIVVLGFAGANTIEVVLAAGLVRRISPVSNLFGRVDWAFRFAVAIFLSVLCSALVAGGALFLGEGRAWIGGGMIWMMGHLPGLLIIVPMLLALRPHGDGPLGDGDDMAARARMPRRLTVLALMVLAAVAAIVAFGQSRYPVQFLLLPPLLLATYRLYAQGAALSVAVIGIIGSFFIFTGSGPGMAFHGPSAVKVYIFEFDLATIFFCALPLGAVLTQRDQKTALAEQRLQDFRLLADGVGDVLFRVDDGGHWSYLNPAFERMSGFDVPSRIGQPMLDGIVAEDRPALALAEAELRGGQRQDLRQIVRISRRDGAIRHAEIVAYRLDGGRGFGGLIRDVTDQMTVDARNRQIAAAHELAANTDELTGLPNRRAFFHALDACLPEAAPHVAVAMFDLDHFKSINDRYGHPVGDIVLRRVATAVQAALRDTDLVARIGGEEFAILIVGETAERAVGLARRVVRVVSAEPIEVPSGPSLHVTISMGVACREGAETRSALMDRVDQALYAAKRGGRNRLTVAGTPLNATHVNATGG
ncbi:diguanylate cyclase [Nguyenibacter vanlangensis]|uniref:diguanylate cyclase n=1 Tax=Nguyenibacter vanlangensis TaxID=1216886 RepID=A0A7Y7IVV9_9PROT|nr:diguanylate cyclase [Nguyenibacter vanlangensis]